MPTAKNALSLRFLTACCFIYLREQLEEKTSGLNVMNTSLEEAFDSLCNIGLDAPIIAVAALSSVLGLNIRIAIPGFNAKPRILSFYPVFARSEEYSELSMVQLLWSGLSLPKSQDQWIPHLFVPVLMRRQAVSDEKKKSKLSNE